MARRLKPAAVTLDVMMPGVDGWAVLAELKSDPQTRDIPVIMLTMMDGKAMGYTLGASEVLTKPINRERLVEVLHKYRQEETIAPVLVVEDDANARHLLRQMLERDGWGVCEASNGREALERLQRSVPRLILLDLMMPEMDGFEFLAELRRQECWRDIPVAVITARDINESERRQLDGAVQQILQKGAYDHRQLLREVRDLLQMPLSKEESH
jgi:CheY-like chemotaxis protein